jgi:hypothetical protein
MNDLRAWWEWIAIRLVGAVQSALRHRVSSIAHPSFLHVHALVIVIDPVCRKNTLAQVILAVSVGGAATGEGGEMFERRPRRALRLR